MFRDITAPYHALESWFYDAAVAPAVADMINERPFILAPVLGAMPDDGRLLDVGCGGGHIAIGLAKNHPAWRIIGLDLSREQVLRAEKRARALADRLHFITGSALALPFEDNAFDALISICSIKHWPVPALGLEECLRVLRPGGTMVVMEVDPHFRREHGQSFVARQRVPLFLKPLALAGFIWKIAARSIQMKDAAPLFDALAVSGVKASQVPGMPLWMISAVKK